MLVRSRFGTKRFTMRPATTTGVVMVAAAPRSFLGFVG
jgi:hypothetical protein